MTRTYGRLMIVNNLYKMIRQVTLSIADHVSQPRALHDGTEVCNKVLYNGIECGNFEMSCLGCLSNNFDAV